MSLRPKHNRVTGLIAGLGAFALFFYGSTIVDAQEAIECETHAPDNHYFGAIACTSGTDVWTCAVWRVATGAVHDWCGRGDMVCIAPHAIATPAVQTKRVCGGAPFTCMDDPNWLPAAVDFLTALCRF